ncbi:MAG: HesA/MoeB/ThiF family protein [Muribaculaceae bacterium]|nr:HesA/MoeB/ThiF family protein [Muribaculaceae bacterium]
MNSYITERYSRQIILREIGEDGQRKLRKSSVLIVGLGGLGSPVALYLSAAGIGRIGLCDNDIVNLSNLQRQILYSESSEGLPKAKSARKRLSELSSATVFDIWEEGLNQSNASHIISRYDIIVDCTDNHLIRYIIDDKCQELGKTWIYGAIEGFEGQVATFCADGPRYSDLFPEREALSMLPSASGGVIGTLPGIIGSLQAAEVIKIICGFGETLVGKLLLFNLKELTLNKIGL